MTGIRPTFTLLAMVSRGEPSQPPGGRDVDAALAQRARVALLDDRYGTLLTARQRRVLTRYYDDDLSLAEIAAEQGVSRQAVHDQLRRAVGALEGLEARLGWLAAVERWRQRAAAVVQAIGRVRAGDDAALADAEAVARALLKDLA